MASCYTPKRNCDDFKTGTFTYQSYINGKMVKTKFIRTDSLEIEYFQDDIDTSTVRWINNCTYILKKLRPKTLQERKAIQIKILTTDSSSYTFEFSVVGSPNKQTGTAVKIN